MANLGIPREFYRLETNEKFHKPGPNKVYCKIFAVSMKQKRKKPGRPEPERLRQGPERPLRGSGKAQDACGAADDAVTFPDGRRASDLHQNRRFFRPHFV